MHARRRLCSELGDLTEMHDEALVLLGEHLEERVSALACEATPGGEFVGVEPLVGAWSACSSVIPARMRVEPREQPMV